MPFIFTNSEIDAEYLNTIYEGDRSLLVSVFEEFLASLPATISHLRMDFEKNDPLLFKKTIHGYKGSFGYTGFSNISQSMQYMENKLAFIPSVNEIKTDFEQMMVQVEATQKIIIQELEQLKK